MLVLLLLELGYSGLERGFFPSDWVKILFQRIRVLYVLRDSLMQLGLLLLGHPELFFHSLQLFLPLT